MTRSLPPLALLWALGCVAACGSSAPAFPTDDELSQIRDLQNNSTPPRETTNKHSDSMAASALGRQLFVDPGFSSCGAVACANCHPPPTYTVPQAFPSGCNGEVSRMPPTLLNTTFNDWYYWDGRKDSLWSHPIFPLLNHTELAATSQTVRTRFESGMCPAPATCSYSDLYQAAFGKAPADEADDNRIVANFGKAMDAYLRTLIKVQAPFDDGLARFLATADGGGNLTADPMYAGLKVFIRTGHCIFCHKGATLSDGSFHNIGVKQPMPDDHGHLTGIPILMADIFNGVGAYSDDTAAGQSKLDTLTTLTNTDLDGAFKTPSLRNVALLGPFMHTGGYQSLSDVIDFYNRGGDPVGTFPGTRAASIVKLGLSSADKQALLDLLMSLTGSENP